jgi:hypothetical protein
VSDDDKSTLKSVVGFFADMFKWIKEALIDDEIRAGIIADLGLDPEQHKSVPPPNFDGYLDGIERYRQTANPDKEALAAAIADIKAVYEALRTFVDVLTEDDSQLTSELSYQLFHIMTTQLCPRAMPLFYWIGSLLGFQAGRVSGRAATAVWS